MAEFPKDVARLEAGSARPRLGGTAELSEADRDGSHRRAGCPRGCQLNCQLSPRPQKHMSLTWTSARPLQRPLQRRPEVPRRRSPRQVSLREPPPSPSAHAVLRRWLSSLELSLPT